MDNTFRIFASIGKFLIRELEATLPVFLFFAVGFLLLLLIIKLALANFSIEITAFSKAIVGALVAAKAALILDETSLARRLEQSRRIIAVAFKTSFMAPSHCCWAIWNDSSTHCGASIVLAGQSDT